MQLHTVYSSITGVKTEHLKIAFKRMVTYSVLCEVLLLSVSHQKHEFCFHSCDFRNKKLREVYAEHSILLLTMNLYHKMCLNLENLHSEGTALLCIL